MSIKDIDTRMLRIYATLIPRATGKQLAEMGNHVRFLKSAQAEEYRAALKVVLETELRERGEAPWATPVDDRTYTQTLDDIEKDCLDVRMSTLARSYGSRNHSTMTWAFTNHDLFNFLHAMLNEEVPRAQRKDPK